tara:strand:+ start:790 stop:1590 length:801 start_codon:yes stop_codon:yes gene_type:complete
MKLGIAIRNMGAQSTRQTMTECAQYAEQIGMDSLWVAEHIAIPPDDAEGSDGRYLDPLITLAYLAGKTKRIGLGTGALILPYRPPLITARLVATLQELAEDRLQLGVGIGWMLPEFLALGLDMRQRVNDSRSVLEFLHAAFGNDEVTLNGQRFLFRPRPSRPPILIGGAPPHAIARALAYGDGWLPMRLSPEALKPWIDDYQVQALSAGKTPQQVVAFTQLPVNDVRQCADLMAAYRDVGVTTLVHSQRYDSAREIIAAMEAIHRT